MKRLLQIAIALAVIGVGLGVALAQSQRMVANRQKMPKPPSYPFEEARRMAQNSLPSYLAAIAPHYEGSGFRDAEETKRAVLGTPYISYSFDLWAIANSRHREGDFREQLDGGVAIQFPVLVDGEPRSNITVEYRDRVWQDGPWGGYWPGLIVQLQERVAASGITERVDLLIFGPSWSVFGLIDYQGQTMLIPLQLVRERARGFLGLGPITRTGTIVAIELFLALLSSFLMTTPLLAAAAPSASLATVVQLPLLFGVFLAPLIAALSAWRVGPYIARAGQWGWMRVAPILLFTLLMSVGVAGFGLRLYTAPAEALWIGLASLMWVLGAGGSSWQERYLPWPWRRRQAWRAWTLRGWGLACAPQCLLGILIPDRALGLWLGVVVSQGIYNIGAQLMVTRVAREAALGTALQKEYRFVWYNQ